MLCFRKFPVATKFMDNRGEGGSIKFFCRKFFVSHCRKTSQGNTQVFHFVGHPKILGTTEGGRHDFPTKLFFLTEY